MNDEEKEWLAEFNKNYEHANFRNSREYLDLDSEGRKEYQEECDLRNNARRRDLYFVAKSSGNLIQYDLHEYDKMTSESERDISAEDLDLNYLESKPQKVRRRRRVKS